MRKIIKNYFFIFQQRNPLFCIPIYLPKQTFYSHIISLTSCIYNKISPITTKQYALTSTAQKKQALGTWRTSSR